MGRAGENGFPQGGRFMQAYAEDFKTESPGKVDKLSRLSCAFFS
jgi:hypothetical protein